ncbi:MAG TPA: tetratricopeptide repeat protein [archaeon]|nr:tetratricopeptide repeat protein [archaeon]
MQESAKIKAAGKPRTFDHWALIPVLLLALAVLAIYGQSLWFGYVNYDDVLILGKQWIGYREFTWENLLRLFTPSGATFQPLRHLAFGLVYLFSGTEPWGYHLFNLLLYFANLLVVFFLFRKLLELSPVLESKKSADFWAWVGTAWFAVHPVHVEVVAWMVSNKELLAGLFYFLSLLCYLKSREGAFALSYYLASWAFLVLGLLSKPSVAALPLVVIVFELFYLGSGFNWKRVALRISPFLVLVAAAACYYIFRSTSFYGKLPQESISLHFFTMSSVLAKYVKILLLPINLSNSYPPPFFSGEYNYRLILYLAVDAAIFTALFWSVRQKKKDIAFGVSFFLLNLLPVSGIVPISIFMADRYLYLSSFGFVFVCILVLIRFTGMLKISVRPRRLSAALAAAGLVFLAAISADRCRAWKDGVTLWREAVRTYPNFQFNHFGLGSALLSAGRLEESLAAFQKANQFKENMKVIYNLARIYDELGDSVSADSCYRRVLRLNSEDVDQPEIMSVVYQRLGMKEELARLWWNRGKSLRNYPEEALRNARRLYKMGYLDKAIEVLDEAVSGSPPASAGLRTSLAAFQVLKGDFESAALTIQAARSNGEDPTRLAVLEADLEFARGNYQQSYDLYASVPVESLSDEQKERLAAYFFASGRLAGALRIFRMLAAGAPPSEAAVHNNVGVVLEGMDSLQAAENEYLRALELKPDYADAWFNLGNVTKKQGKPDRALEYYSRARQIEGLSADVEEARASVLVELKRYSEAFQVYSSLFQLDSTDSRALLGAADVLWEQGRQSLAQRYYQEYLDRFGKEKAPSYVQERITGRPSSQLKN